MNTLRVRMFALAFGILALGATSTSTAAAQSTDRPMYLGLGLGPAVGLNGGGTLFKLEQSFGYHIMPVGDHPGLFIGAALAESFRSHFVRLQIGARAGFDIRVWGNGKMDILVAPMLTLGATVGLARFETSTGTERDASGAFNLGMAGEARLVLADGKWTVWGRPIAVDLDMGRGGVGAYWDFLFGANYNF